MECSAQTMCVRFKIVGMIFFSASFLSSLCPRAFSTFVGGFRTREIFLGIILPLSIKNSVPGLAWVLSARRWPPSGSSQHFVDMDYKRISLESYRLDDRSGTSVPDKCCSLRNNESAQHLLKSWRRYPAMSTASICEFFEEL